MSSEKGVWAEPAFGVVEFYSDECVLNANPDGSLGLVNPLLRRAQSAEDEVERLRKALQECKTLIDDHPDEFVNYPGDLVANVGMRIKAALDESQVDTQPKAAGKQS